jgi:Peptidase family M1 domain
VFVLSVASPHASQAPLAQSEEDLSIQAFLQAVEAAVSSSNLNAWTDLLSVNADKNEATEFFTSMVPEGVTRGVVRERDRTPLLGALPGEGFRLIVDVFAETGPRGHISTWRLDIRRPRDTTDRQPWRILAEEKLSIVEGLHRLSLVADKQFPVRDLVIKSVDFTLRLPSGDVFVAETAEGVTALVLIGDGTMVFNPAPPEERLQVKLFSGTETLETPFTAAYVRMNPYDFNDQLKDKLSATTTPDPRGLRRAQLVFDEEVSRSFSLDLRDLSRENWSLLPQSGDFLAEVRTRRFDTLTYARSTSEPEDVTLFHRARKRNIAAYASEMKLSSRGRFYNEDDLVDYDVVDYAIEANFSPEREWLDATARLRLRVRSYALAALTLRLAEDFTVRSISSDEVGRLMFLRVRNQNSVVINLPNPLSRDAELNLTVTYAGRIQNQLIDQESLEVQGPPPRPPQRSEDLPQIPPEPNWLFSNRSQWYPQGQATDYATATIRFNVPGEYTVVASGVEEIDSPVRTVGPLGRATFTFVAKQPIRYLGVIVSKFFRTEAAYVALDIMPPPTTAAPPARPSPPRPQARPALPPLGSRNTVRLVVEANRRQQDRGRDIVGTAVEILRLYSGLIGDVPYDSMTIAMVENDKPGGHSPGYFAVLNNPLPVMPFAFRNDPAMFANFPEFYVAHEIAHQWWGQAVGWKNYHEQWLSEGFAQYFAALYARERRGEQAFREVMRQFRRWAMDQSDQGAVYQGYRLGHIKSDGRVFRALVYNKGASVLHMLRRLTGDDVFFRGLRRYYAENRFKKAGTEDLQRAMEHEYKGSLDRFFERWIFQSALPRVRYSTVTEGQELVVRFEQVGEIYDIPVTVTLQYGDKNVDEVVLVAAQSVEKHIPLSGTLRGVEVNGDSGALGTFERK